MASLLVCFNFLRDATSDLSWITFEVEVNVFYGLEIIRHFGLIGFLKSKIVLAKMFWVVSVGSNYCLVDKLLLGLRYIVNHLVCSKVNVGFFHCLTCRSSIVSQWVDVRSSLANSLFVNRLSIIHVTMFEISNFKAYCLHFSAHLACQFLGFIRSTIVVRH